MQGVVTNKLIICAQAAAAAAYEATDASPQGLKVKAAGK